jgi:hypothetical protein
VVEQLGQNSLCLQYASQRVLSVFVSVLYQLLL